MTFLKWLQLLFLGLRLCGVINWNWGFVFAPIVVDEVYIAIMREIRKEKVRQFCEYIKEEIEDLELDEDER